MNSDPPIPDIPDHESADMGSSYHYLLDPVGAESGGFYYDEVETSYDGPSRIAAKSADMSEIMNDGDILADLASDACDLMLRIMTSLPLLMEDFETHDTASIPLRTEALRLQEDFDDFRHRMTVASLDIHFPTVRFAETTIRKCIAGTSIHSGCAEKWGLRIARYIRLALEAKEAAVSLRVSNTRSRNRRTIG